MAAFQHLLQRLGFVKLDRFGLELTPDGRILSTRPAVLDDGAGGRIVGWEDTDLAAAELPALLPVHNPVLRPPGHRFIAPPAPPLAAPRARPPAIPPVIPVASERVPVPAPASAGVIPAQVAGGGGVDEDDWEWTIALARARAEDPPRPVAARTLPMAAVPAPPVAAKTLTMAAVPAPPVTAAPVTAPPATAVSGEWPLTHPIIAAATATDYDDYAVVVPTRPVIAIPRIAKPPSATPSTVIPVPALPTVSTANAARLAPVVRTSPMASMESPRRLAKGTGPHDPPSRTKTRAMPAVSESASTEQTRLGVTPANAVGEQTHVGLALPPAPRAVELPSIKRRQPSR